MQFEAPSDKLSLLESDCVDKEGIRMDFGAFNECEGFNNDTDGVKYMRDVLHLRCYSASWVENGWNYVVVKRNKTTRKISYTNKKMFYCMRFRKDPITTNIKLYIFFDSICKFNFSQLRSSDSFFLLDLVPLTSSLVPTSKQTELEQLVCNLPSAVQGQWIENSAYSGNQTIKIGSKTVGLGRDGRYTCMLSDGGKGIQQLFPGNCDQDVWMVRRRFSHFNNSYILTSVDLPIGCRPRFTGLSISQGPSTSNFHFTYRLSRSVVLPIDSVQDPMLFVRKSLPEMFCGDRDLFRLDPYPQWGRNIEKIAIRPHALATNQPLVDCRFQGPLPNMFSGRLRVNVVDRGMKNAKCSGSLDICSSPDICYDFYWGLAAFQQQFHEKIDILARDFMECPTKAPTTEESQALCLKETFQITSSQQLLVLKIPTK
jgi:hypothetical protein